MKVTTAPEALGVATTAEWASARVAAGAAGSAASSSAESSVVNSQSGGGGTSATAHRDRDRCVRFDGCVEDSGA